MWGIFGCAGFHYDRSVNLHTVATSCLTASGGDFYFIAEFSNARSNPTKPHPLRPKLYGRTLVQRKPRYPDQACALAKRTTTRQRAVLSAESQLASPQTSHSLTFASLQLVEMSKGLIDAMLDSVVQAQSVK